MQQLSNPWITTPRGGWIVCVDRYSLERHDIGKYLTPVGRWRHRTARAACARLARIIGAKKTRFSWLLNRPDEFEARQSGRKFYIVAPDGCAYALRELRAQIAIWESK